MNSMKKYVKKPIPIHAFQWNGNFNTLKKNVNLKDLKHFIIHQGVDKHGFSMTVLEIKSLEGNEKCPVGDYVIRGIHGEYYPCDPKIFKESYKEVK